MKFSVSSTVTVLRKGEIKETDKGSPRGHLMLMNDVDCGSVYVPLDIYNSVKDGERVVLDGVYQSFDGKNYISWKSVKPCKG